MNYFFRYFISIFLLGVSFLNAMDCLEGGSPVKRIASQKEIIAAADRLNMRLSREESKVLLKAIKNEEEILPPTLKRRIPKDNIKKLRKQYAEKEDLLKANGWNGRPRNKPFYLMVAEKYPVCFSDYSLFQQELGEISLNIGSLLAFDCTQLLRPQLNGAVNPPIQTTSSLLRQLTFDLINLYKEAQISSPNNTLQEILAWMFKGLDGEALKIFSPVCPDYSYQLKNGAKCYTFNTLGNGVGIVAQSVLKALPLFIDFFKKYKIKVSIWVMLADVEALAPENLRRLSITRETFFERVRESLGAIIREVPEGVHVGTFLSLCKGAPEWETLAKKFEQRFKKGDFGKSTLDEKALLDIVERRKSIYERWHGKKDNPEEYLPYLISQGAQYASFASMIQNKSNCLILGADHPAMAAFYDVEGKMPALYINTNY